MKEMKRVRKSTKSKTLYNYFVRILEPDDIKFCCDIDQVLTMVEGFTMAAPFARCPTCYSNLIFSICEYTCSPEQHKFVFAAEIGDAGNVVDWRKYYH